MSAADKVKLNGVATNANNYTHPSTHPASIIVESTTKRFVTDAEKGDWNAAKNHADSAHAPSTAQKNSDITKEEIEAKLTGELTSHSHAAVGAVQPGMVAFFASRPEQAPPVGWLKANGAAVSRTTYSALFAAISTTFGAGDGSTTFNLPDLRGEFIRGFDDGRSVDPGRGFGSWQADAFRSHRHDLNIFRGNTEGGSYAEDASNTNPQAQNYTGYEGGTETRPRNVALLACIKY
jgi:microcystin-dependent protein